MQEHIDSVRRQLAQVAGMQQRVTASEQRINEAAEDRLQAVGKMLAELRTKVMTDSDAADEYMALIEERGHLLKTLQRSRRHSGAES